MVEGLHALAAVQLYATTSNHEIRLAALPSVPMLVLPSWAASLGVLGCLLQSQLPSCPLGLLQRLLHLFVLEGSHGCRWQPPFLIWHLEVNGMLLGA